ncbi:unnamed protein product [Ambrosiozyma monospora]|uniref:Unnamed protein product n=1 Tax=Ambrosiozyma monospora TaxID=43982 RepID=A0A9W6Z3X8_AMBMO|nr:unnamed protein product [Ambrosiozyma monospora]
MAKVKTQTAKIPSETPFKTNKYYADQVSLIDQPLLKSITVATISQIKQCNYFRAVGHAVTESPDSMPCSKCKQKGHHHLRVLQKQIHPTFPRRD